MGIMVFYVALNIEYQSHYPLDSIPIKWLIITRQYQLHPHKLHAIAGSKTSLLYIYTHTYCEKHIYIYTHRWVMFVIYDAWVMNYEPFTHHISCMDNIG